jgi:cytochrome b pre-mRNA-processing protein 3
MLAVIHVSSRRRRPVPAETQTKRHCIGRQPAQYAVDTRRTRRLGAKGQARLATLFKRLLGGRRDARALVPLYDAIVREARQAHWYVEGRVPDTLDGRFDMVSTVLSLVLLRMETLGEQAREPSARLTELFVTDMDGQLRQHGIGDLVVGKHIGRMMSQVGGRLTAYREGLADGGDLTGAIARNVYRGADVAEAAKAHVETGLHTLAAGLETRDLAALLAGDIA